MKRFIITYLDKNEKIGVVVVKALTEKKALANAMVKFAHKYIREIIAIRELYNPMEDPSTSWMFKHVDVPKSFLIKCKIWSTYDYLINFNSN